MGGTRCLEVLWVLHLCCMKWSMFLPLKWLSPSQIPPCSALQQAIVPSPGQPPLRETVGPKGHTGQHISVILFPACMSQRCKRRNMTKRGMGEKSGSFPFSTQLIGSGRVTFIA